MFTGRRNFIAILSGYYLLIPGTLTSEIGLYTAIGFLGWFLMNIPGGVFADRFGYKNTIIFSKILLLGSSIAFLNASGFMGFAVGSLLMSLSVEWLMVGAGSSYLRDYLTSLGKGDQYRHIMSTIKADVSLLSIAFIIGIPFLMQWDIRAPFMVWAGIDLIGLIVAVCLPNAPRAHLLPLKKDRKSIIALARELKWSLFLPLSLFTGIISACLLSESVFRLPYLMSLGYPITLAGVMMGFSRGVWFIVGRNTRLIEKWLPGERIIIFDIVAFTSYFLLSSSLSNPYLTVTVFIIGVGYFWGRAECYSDMFFDQIPDKAYQATMSSFRSQLWSLLQVILTFGIGFVMQYSFKIGFASMGIVLGISTTWVYLKYLRGKLPFTPEGSSSIIRP
jgi:MFS family permease